MAKVIKKKSSKKKVNSPRISAKEKSMEKILIENFVSLQNVMTNLSEKFDHLTKQTSNLLKLFEDSAKTVIKRDFQPLLEKEVKLDTKGMESKLDNLLEQNKIIAKGLTLIHDTAKNPNVNYVVGTKPSIKEMPPLEPISSQPTMKPFDKNNSKKIIREEPALPKF